MKKKHKYKIDDKYSYLILKIKEEIECPVCKKELKPRIENLLIRVKGSYYEDEIIANNEAYFCDQCKIIIFDKECILEIIEIAGIKKFDSYSIKSLLNISAIPKSRSKEPIYDLINEPIPIPNLLIELKKYKSATKTKKIKYNEPCPCGSGKKYKNCCMNK